VEAALRSHASVAQASVIGIPDPLWGEAVHAVVILRAGVTCGNERMTDELRAWCRQRLAGYKCPRGITFAQELPMSAAGKVLKNVLRERVAA
jgi:acyl-coenzyme A synthetase/AMP-(fatty) acid ligase